MVSSSHLAVLLGSKPPSVPKQGLLKIPTGGSQEPTVNRGRFIEKKKIPYLGSSVFLFSSLNLIQFH